MSFGFLTISSLKRSTTAFPINHVTGSQRVIRPLGGYGSAAARRLGVGELMSPELVERRADVVEHLGGDVIGQAVADDVSITAPPDRRGLTEYPKVMAGRGTAPLDDYREVAGGKLGYLERAHDLEPGRIAQAHEDALGIASGSRRKHPRLGLRDRAGINDLVSRSHVFLSARI